MKKILTGLFAFVLASLLFSSCEKDDNLSKTTETNVKFAFSVNGLKGIASEGLTNVVITIEDMQGNIVKDNEQIEIYNMNENYISKPVSLLTGNYKLTGFLVLNSANNVVYAAPIDSSDKAYLVQDPLPIEFDATMDVVTKVNLEVLSTAESYPDDFGYASFGFNIADTFDFLVGAFKYNDSIENFELTTGDITVYSGETLVYSGELQANTDFTSNNYDPLGITNKITLPETYDNFTINISKSGYLTYSKTFTKEELRLYCRNEDNGPLVIILEKIEIPGLIAYYPFNNDYNDKSGNNYHGENHGSIFGIDRNGTDNSALEFDGIDDYVILPSDFDLKEKSISFWFYSSVFPTFDYVNDPINSWDPVITIDHSSILNGIVHFNVTNSEGINLVWFTQLWDYQQDLHEISMPISSNLWYHAVITMSSNEVKFYINGVLAGNHVAWFGHSVNGNSNLMIGTDRNINGRFLDGGVDELRIFNRVLNETEIQLLFENF